MSKKTVGDFDFYNYGPIQMKRDGRNIEISNTLSEEEHREYVKEVRENRPDLKAKINKNISDIIKIAKTGNPIDFLTSIAIKNLTTVPESYNETTHEGREAYVEYALSVITGIDDNEFKNLTSSKLNDIFSKKIKETFDNIEMFFSTEVAEGKKSLAEYEIRHSLLLSFLIFRGPSYEKHHRELFIELFSPHNEYLKKTFGFNTEDLLVFITNIFENIQNFLDKSSEYVKLIMQLRTIFLEKMTDHESNFENFKQDFFKDKNNNAMKEKILKLQNETETNPFIIEVKDELTKKILEFFSCRIGDNKQFIEFEKSPAWPTNNSIVYYKPILYFENNYYCFSPQLLFRKIINILEHLIITNDAGYFDSNYQKKRAEYLENKTIEYFKQILPDAEFHQNLFYDIEEDGKSKRAEADGIILYNNNIFIIEAKATSLSLASRRGGLKRVQDETNEIIEKAHQQALRTKRYINDTQVPTFRSEQGYEVLILRDKSIYKNFYLINTSLAYLGSLATHLRSLQVFKFLKGNEWPWSVFINDLRVLSELIEFPSEFLFYLQNRTSQHESNRLYSSDELDYFLYFLSEGAKKFGSIDTRKDMIFLNSFTPLLDRYYDYQDGKVSSGEKPKLDIIDNYKKLIIDIEKQNSSDFSEITTILLQLNKIAQENFLSNLKLLERKVHDTEKESFKTMIFSQLAIFLSVRKENTKDISRKNYKQFEKHNENRTCVFFQKSLLNNQKAKYLFKVNKKNPKTTCIFNSRKGKTTGRNEPCPCESGKKYKDCCGK